MELTVKQEHLAKALNIIGKVASNRSSLPILSNILLKTNGSRLMLVGTNLEIAISQNIGAKIEKVGSITIPPKIVSEFVSSLPKGNILLKVEDNHLLIESGNYKSRINGIASDEFPELPTIENKTSSMSINSDDFKNAVSQTVITASNDTTRPILTGVYMHTVDGNLYLASTDGYRLSERRLAETSEEISAIIPASSLREVVGAINDGVEEIYIEFDDMQVRFVVGDVEIISRLIDGKYVDYRKLIPNSTENNIKIRKDEFLRVVKIAALFARDSGGSVTLKTDEEQSLLSIHSIASEIGENTSSATAEITGDGEITLNSRYIIEAIGAVGASDISFGFSGKLAPTVMRSAKNDDYVHIIMPLKS